MGCDIHPYIDYEREGYKKGDVLTDNFAKLDGDRDYILFGLLTNGRVRIPDCEGYAPDPRPAQEDVDVDRNAARHQAVPEVR